MTDLLTPVRELFDVGLVRAIVILGAGYALGALASRFLTGLIARRTHVIQPPIVRQLIKYGIVVMAVFMAIEALGFDAGVLLGAAGVLTIAVGFASQTSVSNLISGLFLITERPFVIGDTVKIGATVGVTHSIGFMSVTLRTFDNLYVRVPNELLIKSEITNYSRFPLRRFDLELRVRLDEDIERVEQLLRDIATDHPLVLEEPAEGFLFQAYNASSYDFRFSVWTRQEDYLAVRNQIPRLVKRALHEQGIEIPVPRTTVDYILAPPPPSSDDDDDSKDAR